MKIYVLLFQICFLVTGALSKTVVNVKGHIVITRISDNQTESEIQLESGFTNCRDLLDGKAQLLWDVEGDYIKYRLSARIAENEWAAVGVSGDPEKTKMVGGDPVVIFYTPADETFHALDYTLLGKSECDGENGACPDTRAGGEDNLEILTAIRQDGVTSVVFMRPIAASDSSDLALADEAILIYAIGPLNANNEVSYHSARTDPEALTKINTKGSGDFTCQQLLIPGEEPPPTEPEPEPEPGQGEFTNCRDLLDGAVQLHWEADGDYVAFKLSARMAENEWAAFGVSGAQNKTQMFKGDAIIIYYTPADETFHADDYYLAAKAECDGQKGVCLDTQIGGHDDVEVLSGSRKNGVTSVIFKRPIAASDPVMDLELLEETIIINAIGPFNDQNKVTYHSAKTDPAELIKITLSGSGDNTCDGILEDKEEGGQEPPPPSPSDGFTNCRMLLNDEIQLHWDMDGDFIKFKLSARMSEDEWAAVGVSGNPDSTKMFGGDPIVIHYTPGDGAFHANDYILLGKSQCNGKTGACPDVRVGGEDNVEIISGYRKNGVTSVTFKRPIAASDTSDLELEDDAFIINAIGPLNANDEVSYHRARSEPTEAVQINTKGTGDNTCAGLIEDIIDEEVKAAPLTKSVPGLPAPKPKILAPPQLAASKPKILAPPQLAVPTPKILAPPRLAVPKPKVAATPELPVQPPVTPQKGRYSKQRGRFSKKRGRSNKRGRAWMDKFVH